MQPSGVQVWGGVLITFLSLGATILFGLLNLRKRVATIQVDLQEVGSRVELVEKRILAGQFTVTTPVNGATVEMIDFIRGNTPLSGMNHYIVVTPLKTGDDWVQEKRATVSGGIWSGRAKFGTAAVGAGEQFVVRALATKSTLSPGPLTEVEVPEDAIFSEPITVTRKK